MDQRNVAFLETYKRLDKLCQELYDAEKGVTSYIDDLKQQSAIGRRRIPGWDHDLNQLIALRHLRNRLTHEVGTMEEPLCTQEDIKEIETMHQRILSRTDPLAQLRKVLQTTRLRTTRQKKVPSDTYQIPGSSYQTNKKSVSEENRQLRQENTAYLLSWAASLFLLFCAMGIVVYLLLRVL